MGKKAKEGAWFPDGTAEARLLFKYEMLLEDYLDLRKETLAKRRKFLRLSRKKLELVPIVKFLRKKLKSFYESPPQTEQFELKKQSPNDMRDCELPPLQKSLNPGEGILAGGNQQTREPTSDGCSRPMVDLNVLPSQDVDEAVESGRLLNVPKSNAGVGSKVKWKDPVVSSVHFLPVL